MKATKKLISGILMIVLCFSYLHISGFDSTAATAKGLNFRSAKLQAGKKLTLKLVGIKGNILWSSKNKNIAAVNSKGVVTGKKVGKTAIYASCNSRIYKCTLQVTERPLTNEEIVKRLKYTSHVTRAGIVVEIENPTKERLGVLFVTVQMFDKAGNLIKDNYTSVNYVEAGSKVVAFMDYPNSSLHTGKDYASHKIKLSIDKERYKTIKNYGSNIVSECIIPDDKSGAVVDFTNTSNQPINRLLARVVYYLEGEIVGISNCEYVDIDISGNGTGYFSKPRSYILDEVVEYDSCKVYVLNAVQK